MTVAEATVIADNALEHTVRTILASLQAPEILKSTSGKQALAEVPCVIRWSWRVLLPKHQGQSTYASACSVTGQAAETQKFVLGRPSK